MAKIVVSRAERKRFSDFAVRHADKIMRLAIARMDKILFEEAEKLADRVRESEEFKALKTPTLIGQFGFTPQEVANLDNLFPVIQGGDKSITNVKVKTMTKIKSAILNWVDFAKLKDHPVAEHELTSFDARSRTFSVDQIVSWIEWWEEGVTVRGHIFTRGNELNRSFSRSGLGIMMPRSGGFFLLRPTMIFQKTGAQSGEIKQRLQRSFQKLVQGIST
jgi:hypothetical protein